MILFTAEPLRFFIYISVCCWTFELSLLLNLWDYLLLLNLWIFFTAEPLRLCPGLCICLLLNLWDYPLLLNLWIFFTAEPLNFFYCWIFEIMPWIMYLFAAEPSQRTQWPLNSLTKSFRYIWDTLYVSNARDPSSPYPAKIQCLLHIIKRTFWYFYFFETCNFPWKYALLRFNFNTNLMQCKLEQCNIFWEGQ